MSSRDQLQSFKTDINLMEYAESCGYQLIKKESSQHSAVMKSESGDKIVVAKSQNGHWIYFSVHDGSDNGTIIDFVLNRKAGNNFGRAKAELARWQGEEFKRDDRQESLRFDLKPSSKDRQRVIQAFSRMKAVESHPYLESRGITPEILMHDQFRDRVFLDDRRNAVFPHHDADGLCGYEIKNRGFTGFAPGGEKVLWSSNHDDQISNLIVAESAIDALSYFALKKRDGVYVSTGGSWSPKTSEALLSLADSLQAPGQIILAFDHDKAGLENVEKGRAILEKLKDRLIVDLPEEFGKDWNDELHQSKRSDIKLTSIIRLDRQKPV